MKYSKDMKKSTSETELEKIPTHIIIYFATNTAKTYFITQYPEIYNTDIDINNDYNTNFDVNTNTDINTSDYINTNKVIYDNINTNTNINIKITTNNDFNKNTNANANIDASKICDEKDILVICKDEIN